MNALVLGATGGLGSAISELLRDQGSDVTELSRADGLDWQHPTQAEGLLQQVAKPFELIFDATGALKIGGAGPERQLAAIDAEAMATQFAVNAIGPALVLKHYRKLMPESGRTVFATLSARVGSIGDNRLGGWISYRAAKAALNQVVRTAAIEIARTRPEAIVVALHPGTVATELSAPFAGNRTVLSPDESARRLLEVLTQLRPSQSGGFFAYDGQPVPW